ncbi:hypothetical protein AF332_20510 [Sporosarcina globispora]|uniref:Uncharacterized protein n=1 Tax=Sporosarcina globispora TaxID=1459 RepID=A0A0M0GHL7_SPOGL|nr:hypothetical protein [Sporosarcina globispora]KON88936.1 hypothetical protein AF332_20510 [Sporosarcina globispora]
MFIEAKLIDENGFIVDTVAVKDTDVLEANLIKEPVPPLLYKPRWTENGWVEGATEEYIKHEDNRTTGTADMDLLKPLEKPKPKPAPKPKPVQKPKEEDDMLGKAIVINGFADFPAAERLALNLKAPIYLRSTVKGKKVAKELYVVGGTKDGIVADKVTLLSGADRFETATAVGEFLK